MDTLQKHLTRKTKKQQIYLDVRETFFVPTFGMEAIRNAPGHSGSLTPQIRKKNLNNEAQIIYMHSPQMALPLKIQRILYNFL